MLYLNSDTEIEKSVSNQAHPSRLAKAILVITILAVIGCPLLIFGPITLILGLIELFRINQGKSNAIGKNYALAGVIVGFIATLIIPIAIRGYYAAYIRSKVGLARGNIRMIATVMESYFVDYGSYPLPEYDYQNNPVTPLSLTTPISYISYIPKDPFSPQGKQLYRSFSGYTMGINFWIVASVGPNNKMDFDIRTYNPLDTTWLEKYGIPFQYDPTNGVSSPGDIWRIGP